MIRALVLLPFPIVLFAVLAGAAITWPLVQAGMRFLKALDMWLGRAPR